MSDCVTGLGKNGEKKIDNGPKLRFEHCLNPTATGTIAVTGAVVDMGHNSKDSGCKKIDNDTLEIVKTWMESTTTKEKTKNENEMSGQPQKQLEKLVENLTNQIEIGTKDKNTAVEAIGDALTQSQSNNENNNNNNDNGRHSRISQMPVLQVAQKSQSHHSLQLPQKRFPNNIEKNVTTSLLTDNNNNHKRSLNLNTSYGTRHNNNASILVLQIIEGLKQLQTVEMMVGHNDNCGKLEKIIAEFAGNGISLFLNNNKVVYMINELKQMQSQLNVISHVWAITQYQKLIDRFIIIKDNTGNDCVTSNIGITYAPQQQIQQIQQIQQQEQQAPAMQQQLFQSPHPMMMTQQGFNNNHNSNNNNDSTSNTDNSGNNVNIENAPNSTNSAIQQEQDMTHHGHLHQKARTTMSSINLNTLYGNNECNTNMANIEQQKQLIEQVINELKQQINFETIVGHSDNCTKLQSMIDDFTTNGILLLLDNVKLDKMINDLTTMQSQLDIMTHFWDYGRYKVMIDRFIQIKGNNTARILKIQKQQQIAQQMQAITQGQAPPPPAAALPLPQTMMMSGQAFGGNEQQQVRHKPMAVTTALIENENNNDGAFGYCGNNLSNEGGNLTRRRQIRSTRRERLRRRRKRIQERGARQIQGARQRGERRGASVSSDSSSSSNGSGNSSDDSGDSSVDSSQCNKNRNKVKRKRNSYRKDGNNSNNDYDNNGNANIQFRNQLLVSHTSPYVLPQDGDVTVATRQSPDSNTNNTNNNNNNNNNNKLYANEKFAQLKQLTGLQQLYYGEMEAQKAICGSNMIDLNESIQELTHSPQLIHLNASQQHIQSHVISRAQDSIIRSNVNNNNNNNNIYNNNNINNNNINFVNRTMTESDQSVIDNEDDMLQDIDFQGSNICKNDLNMKVLPKCEKSINNSVSLNENNNNNSNNDSSDNELTDDDLTREEIEEYNKLKAQMRLLSQKMKKLKRKDDYAGNDETEQPNKRRRKC